MSDHTTLQSPNKNCAVCGTPFFASQSSYKYCREECRTIGYGASVSAAKKRFNEAHREELNAWMRDWRERNPERDKENKRKSYQVGAETRKQYRLFYRQEHANRVRAQESVAKAVGRGKLPHASTLLCVRCGVPATEYHHWSYEREDRLKVEAMCAKCHKAADKERIAMEAK